MSVKQLQHGSEWWPRVLDHRVQPGMVTVIRYVSETGLDDIKPFVVYARDGDVQPETLDVDIFLSAYNLGPLPLPEPIDAYLCWLGGGRPPYLEMKQPEHDYVRVVRGTFTPIEESELSRPS